MISRRLFLTTAATLIGALQASANQRSAPHRIGYLAPGDADSEGPYYDAFREGLKALGHIESKDILLEFRPAQNRVEALPALAEELLRLKAELIFVLGTAAAKAARQASDSIPIVFASVSDPVGSGVVATLAHPGGNTTGITDASVELTGKRLDLLKELLPRLKRVAVLGYPADALWKPVWTEAQASAQQLHIEIVPVQIATPHDFDIAFRQLRPAVNAILVAPQSFLWRIAEQ